MSIPNKTTTRHGPAPFLHYGKPLLVTLEPGDILAMRLEGHPTVHRAPLAKIFVQLCYWTASESLPEPAE